MSFRNILVPIDFDETSDHALSEALSLGSKLGAKVTLVHVYDLPIYNFPDGTYIPTADVADNLRAGELKQLEAFTDKQRAAGHEINAVLRVGRAVEEICAVA